MIVESYHDVNGQRIRVLNSLDRPGLPLLIFNGIGASADMLRPLLNSLECPVLTFDLPGVGGSPAGLLPKRMAQLASLAHTLLESFSIERCHIMGISWGGGLAQQFAHQFPEQTQRLILAATATGHIMVPPRLSVMFKLATPLRYLSARYFRSIAGDIYGGDFRDSPKRTETHSRQMTPPSVWGYLSQLYALTGWTSIFWLGEIKAQTLVMAGDDDPIVPLANARLLAHRLPNARLSIYDCGHLFILTRLERARAEIDAFLHESG
ncbi:MAG: alpha/beta fold hydrolase [Gammaproteobacteria bacterium]|nr:alpha/beta fold hydrolase [Gammaproteobacteria bacterium]